MWNARETPENEICIDIDLLMIREIFKIVITWQKKNKNIYTIICKVQWMDGAKILYGIDIWQVGVETRESKCRGNPVRITILSAIVRSSYQI